MAQAISANLREGANWAKFAILGVGANDKGGPSAQVVGEGTLGS